jgi:RNA-directed DNA polymerase
MFINKTFHTSEYTTFMVYDPKEREVLPACPYFPDRIAHHAVMNILEPVFFRHVHFSIHIAALKRRGIHRGLRDGVKKALRRSGRVPGIV